MSVYIYDPNPKHTLYLCECMEGRERLFSDEEEGGEAREGSSVLRTLD